MTANSRGVPLGLRTVIYRVSNLSTAKGWYASVFGVEPYFDQPFYVGFSIGGFELGLDPEPNDRDGSGSSGVAYWGVANADDAFAHFLSLGATEHSAVRDVGDGIRVASVSDPFGNIIGLIENPHFDIGAVR